MLARGPGRWALLGRLRCRWDAAPAPLACLPAALHAAAAPRCAAQADELCRRCVLCVMRALLGEDDTAILAEAQVRLPACF